MMTWIQIKRDAETVLRFQLNTPATPDGCVLNGLPFQFSAKIVANEIVANV